MDTTRAEEYDLRPSPPNRDRVRSPDGSGGGFQAEVTDWGEALSPGGARPVLMRWILSTSTGSMMTARTYNCDDRDESVSQRVLVDHLELAQPLCAGGDDVIQVEYFQHARARLADRERDLRYPESYYRQN